MARLASICVVFGVAGCAEENTSESTRADNSTPAVADSDSAVVANDDAGASVVDENSASPLEDPATAPGDSPDAEIVDGEGRLDTPGSSLSEGEPVLPPMSILDDPGVAPGENPIEAPAKPPVVPVSTPMEKSLVVRDDELALRDLEGRVATRFVDERNFDSWVCSGLTGSIEFRLTLGASRERLGIQFDGEDASSDITFGWAAISPDTLLFDYPSTGRQIELGSILFLDEIAFRANDSASGPVECREQAYVDGVATRDVSVNVLEDVDPAVEAADLLAGRMATRRREDGSVDYWLCEVVDGAPIGYVFAEEGVLDTEQRAILFEIAAVAEFEPTGEQPSLPVVPERTGPLRPVFNPDVHTGVAFSWSATSGTSLVLVPLNADLTNGEASLASRALDDIVFPAANAFTATRSDGDLLQCLRDGGL